jgi:hypothetical protein
VITQRYDFIGRLDGRTVLGDGSVRYTARLTRTGVFDYGDHKELRLPEEVFKPASVETFKGLSVTDGHRAHIDPENWKTHAVGHVGDDVKQDGRFLVASIVVKDKATIAKIDRKELVELSMGYTVNLDERSGEYDGEHFDAIQRDIIGNHAALGPSNWGRAGSSVRVLDGAGEPVADRNEGAAYAPVDMTTPALRIDAPSSSDDSIRKDLDSARADAEAVRKERDTARTERDEANKRADKAEAERDAAKKDAEKAKTDADAQKAAAEKSGTDAQAKADEKIQARIELLDAARGILGADFKPTKKDGEKTVPMTDKDIRVAVLTKVDASLKLDGKSDEYIAVRFELACDAVKTDRGALGKVNETVTNATTTASGTKSKLDEAFAKADADRKAASEAGPPAGAMVRRK